MQEMKYVVVKSEEQGEQLFVFPSNVNHDSFAEILSYIKFGDGKNWQRIYRETVSAGFTDGSKCYGKSETLNISSRPEDTQLLLKGGK
jgi:thioredoxin-related protein